MSDRAREFVAEDLWLLVAIVTFVLTALAAIAGFGSLTPVVAIIGWFLLTPIFLFWGEEIATMVYGEEGTEAPVSDAEDDALAELKRRYAEGEIDDEEFEHRLDRLLEVDAAMDADGIPRSARGATGQAAGREAAGDEEPTVSTTSDAYERERARER